MLLPPDLDTVGFLSYIIFTSLPFTPILERHETISAHTISKPVRLLAKMYFTMTLQLYNSVSMHYTSEQMSNYLRERERDHGLHMLCIAIW